MRLTAREPKASLEPAGTTGCPRSPQVGSYSSRGTGSGRLGGGKVRVL